MAQGVVLIYMKSSNLYGKLKLAQVKTTNLQDRQKFLNQLEDFIFSVALNFILRNLNDSNARKFLQYLESEETQNLAFDFAKDHIPDLENKIARTIEEECGRIFD